MHDFPFAEAHNLIEAMPLCLYPVHPIYDQVGSHHQDSPGSRLPTPLGASLTESAPIKTIIETVYTIADLHQTQSHVHEKLF